MLHVDLDAVTEDHLQALCTQHAEEGLRLEFKREMDLATREGRFETAKVIAAMANAAGGRIVYGMEEASKDQGPATAAKLVPLGDAALIERYRDALYGLIFPPPKFRYRRVDVGAGGFLLVTEVYSSAGRDLHGVQRREDIRFWRRGLTRNQPMTEPEVREAYSRIAVSSQQLEAAIEGLVLRELRATTDHQENLLVVPWFARPNLADPRLLAGIGQELAKGPLQHLTTNLDLFNLRPSSRGIVAVSESSGQYFAATREGILHFAERERIRTPTSTKTFTPVFTLRRLLGLLAAARLVLGRVGYWGPVRVLHDLSLPDCVFARGDWEGDALPAGQYRQQLSEVRLDEVGGDLEPVAREIMDQVYQIVGRTRCDWFDESGHLETEVRKNIWGSFPPVGAPP